MMYGANPYGQQPQYGAQPQMSGWGMQQQPGMYQQQQQPMQYGMYSQPQQQMGMPYNMQQQVSKKPDFLLNKTLFSFFPQIKFPNFQNSNHHFQAPAPTQQPKDPFNPF